MTLNDRSNAFAVTGCAIVGLSTHSVRQSSFPACLVELWRMLSNCFEASPCDVSFVRSLCKRYRNAGDMVLMLVNFFGAFWCRHDHPKGSLTSRLFLREWRGHPPACLCRPVVRHYPRRPPQLRPSAPWILTQIPVCEGPPGPPG